MNKKTILASCICLCCLCGCSSETEVALPEANTLSLVSPNGDRIAANMSELRQRTSNIIAKQFGDDYSFTIEDIKYTDVTTGFLAIIEYKLENGVTSNYAYSNNVKILNNVSLDQLTIEESSEGDYIPLGDVGFTCNSASKCAPCQVVSKTYFMKTDDGNDRIVTEVSCSTKCSDCKMNATIIR